MSGDGRSVWPRVWTRASRLPSTSGIALARVYTRGQWLCVYVTWIAYAFTMPMLRYESIVARPIADIWAAFQDVQGFLPTLTPPKQKLIVESASPLPPKLGTDVVISVKGPFGRVRWTARYTAFVPPHATMTGVEARFVDEQISGPFKRWTQSHEFEAASDRTTRCIDVIDYAAPWGPIGWVGDVLLLRWMVRGMLTYRHRKLAELFGRE